MTGDAGIGKTRLAAELARRARDGGFETLLGRSIDLVGTELPYQPFAEALRPLGGPRPADAPPGSQLRVFEETLARLADTGVAGHEDGCAAARPRGGERALERPELAGAAHERLGARLHAASIARLPPARKALISIPRAADRAPGRGR